MSSASTTFSRLVAVLLPLAPGRLEEFRAEDRLTEQLGFDSVDLARVVLALEDAFDIELPQDQLHQLKTATLAEVATLIEQSGGQA